jgi:hypothetical protein
MKTYASSVPVARIALDRRSTQPPAAPAPGAGLLRDKRSTR